MDVRSSGVPGSHHPGSFPSAYQPQPAAPRRPQALDKLDEVRKTVENARSMPMSASCMINRTELLADLEEVANLLPAELGEAQQVLDQRRHLLDDAQARANRLIEDGRRQRDAQVSQTDIYRAAQEAVQELRQQAEADSAALRRETDDYVDHKLAGFEIALQRTLATISRGRDRLRSRVSHMDESDDIAVQRREVDEYVDHKLTRFEQTLAKTLDAVSRGRERLRDRSGLDTYATGTDEEEAPLHGD